jgi:HlyD family secretion protein
VDQFVNPPKAESETSIETALGLDGKGATKQRRHRLGYTIMALVAVAAAFAGYRYLSADTPRIEYSTQAAVRSDLVIEVSATGTLQPLTQVDISSELSGIVRSVAVAENQEVGKGDVLATLDTSKLEVQIERAKASARAAASKVDDATVTLRENDQALVRTDALTKRGMATAQALEAATATRDRAKAALESAEANLAIAEADLKAQQTDLDKSTIYAPIDGVVLTRSVDPGQTVASSLQAPVLFVLAADLKKMELKAAIDEADIGTVRSGQQARFSVDAFPERRFDAIIRDISYASVTTDGVVTYDARLEVENDELLLRPGMTATVTVVTKHAKDALTVPTAAFRYRPAMQQRESGWNALSMFTGRMQPPRERRGQQQQTRQREADGTRMLYVLKNGEPRPVRVHVGSTNGELTEILSGISEGDLIVTSQQQRG